MRRKVIDVHGERISGVQRARQEGGEELEKIKEKLHEVREFYTFVSRNHDAWPSN